MAGIGRTGRRVALAEREVRVTVDPGHGFTVVIRVDLGHEIATGRHTVTTRVGAGAGQDFGAVVGQVSPEVVRAGLGSRAAKGVPLVTAQVSVDRSDERRGRDVYRVEGVAVAWVDVILVRWAEEARAYKFEARERRRIRL